MCCGSAARRNRRFGAADHALAHVRLTAKPRYFLLLHRGKNKSNTVTALFEQNVKYKKINEGVSVSLHKDLCHYWNLLNE